MENIIRKIFKINIDPIFDTNINLQQQEFVIEKILETGIFIIRNKTNIHFSENFFMEYDEDCIIEKLTTLKYNSEFFFFKSVSITICKENNPKSNCFLLNDFYSEKIEQKLKNLYNELTTIKKESNWSLLSLKDLLDVDYKKQTDKADTYFIRGEYSDAMKIYSRFKTEDDFSHYNMEMEVYCRYLTNSNPYENFIHFTNTNFVNSFYHHRLVIVLLLINQTDFCYRISRLLNESYKMFIDLELSKRYLKDTLFKRKGLDLLFFCILYYRNMNFPCDKLMECFIESANPNEKILEEPLKYLKNLKNSPESCGIDMTPIFKIDFLSKFEDVLPIRFSEQRHFIMIKYKNDVHNLYITFDKDLNINLDDKIYIFYTSKCKNFLRYTIKDQSTLEKINITDVEIEKLCNKHVVFEHDIVFQPSKGVIFTLKDFINQINKSKNHLFWCKEVIFNSEGLIIFDGLSIYNDIDVIMDTKIQISTDSCNLFFVNHEHVLYQNQIYQFEITKTKDYGIVFEELKTYSDNIDIKFDYLGFIYIPFKVFSFKKTYTMYIKFTIITHYFIDFSWSNIFPSLITISVFNPSNTNVKLFINQLNCNKTKIKTQIKNCRKIEGRIYKSNNYVLDKTFYIGHSCDIMSITNSYEKKLKQEVLGIGDKLIEDFNDGELEINSPITTSLDFSSYLNKHKNVSFNTRGDHSIQFYPQYTGLYDIILENDQQTFIIPFNINFTKIDMAPFIYILSSNLIRTGTIVKVFCLINNHYKTDLFMKICSNTIEMNQKDTKLTCKSTKASIFEIRCKFMLSKKYTNLDFQIKVSDKDNNIYNYKLCVDLNVI